MDHDACLSNSRRSGGAMAPLTKRKRATAIVVYPEGILLAVMRHMAPALPGGGVKPGETDEAAVRREVLEETGLHAQTVQFLFRHQSLANDHAVFWVQASGHPHPCEEVDRIAYYQPHGTMRVSPDTQTVLDHFYQVLPSYPELAALIRG